MRSARKEPIVAVRLALSCVGDEMKWRERDRGEQGPGNQQQDEGGAGCLGVEGDLDANKVDGGVVRVLHVGLKVVAPTTLEAIVLLANLLCCSLVLFVSTSLASRCLVPRHAISVCPIRSHLPLVSPLLDAFLLPSYCCGWRR